MPLLLALLLAIVVASAAVYGRWRFTEYRSLRTIAAGQLNVVRTDKRLPATTQAFVDVKIVDGAPLVELMELHRQGLAASLAEGAVLQEPPPAPREVVEESTRVLAELVAAAIEQHGWKTRFVHLLIRRE